MHSTAWSTRVSPAWPHDEPYEDLPRGTLKSGKEAEIFLVERRYASGARLLAHKRYRPRYPRKGQLRAEGFSNSTSYRGDSIYKAGWFLPTRDKKAVMGGSRYGHELAFRLWPIQEWTMVRRAWEAGASVPYPVEQTDHGPISMGLGWTWRPSTPSCWRWRGDGASYDAAHAHLYRGLGRERLHRCFV